jgi:predicted DCC family thiol-disulfide oxidoreductase YuxK
MNSITVWYDGSCPLCSREIAMMRRLDCRKAIVFVDVADEAVNCPLDRSLLLARLHAYENGKMLTGAEAFAAMWRALPLLRPLGLLARNRLVLNGLERLYRLFLQFRPQLQRLMASSSF